jgi:hypothetical protein
MTISLTSLLCVSLKWSRMPLTKLTAGLEVTAVTDLKKLLEEVSKATLSGGSAVPKSLECTINRAISRIPTASGPDNKRKLPFWCPASG